MRTGKRWALKVALAKAQAKLKLINATITNIFTRLYGVYTGFIKLAADQQKVKNEIARLKAELKKSK